MFSTILKIPYTQKNNIWQMLRVNCCSPEQQTWASLGKWQQTSINGCHSCLFTVKSWEYDSLWFTIFGGLLSKRMGPFSLLRQTKKVKERGLWWDSVQEQQMGTKSRRRVLRKGVFDRSGAIQTETCGRKKAKQLAYLTTDFLTHMIIFQYYKNMLKV